MDAIGGGQKFIQTNLIHVCSMGMQDADFINNLSKMIKCCHFSVLAQTFISKFYIYQYCM